MLRDAAATAETVPQPHPLRLRGCQECSLGTCRFCGATTYRGLFNRWGTEELERYH